MALKTEEMVLNLGPQHPSTHGVLRLELELDGELILNMIPHIGYLHRCFEKHCEAMTYPQVISKRWRILSRSLKQNRNGVKAPMSAP